MVKIETAVAPSLYAQYITERCGYEIVERPDGYVTYEISGQVLYIRDIFVRLHARRRGIATQLADQVCAIATARGCTTLVGTIDPTTKGAHDSLLGLLAYGMRLSHLANGLIVLHKDLVERDHGHG